MLYNFPASLFIAEVLRQQLICGNTDETYPAKYGALPANITNVVVVSDTTPIVDGRSGQDKVTRMHYGLQIRVRGSTYLIAARKAKEIEGGNPNRIHDGLCDLANTVFTITVNSVDYNVRFCAFTLVAPTTHLPNVDEKELRQTFVINGLLSAEEEG